MAAINSGGPLTCPVSGSTDCEVFLEIRQVPVLCNVLYATREEALAAPRGDLALAFCRECGHVFNAAFDASLMEYSQVYENSLHFSPRFQEFATRLADRLIETYDIRGKQVIDIGCGKGDFLQMLCERGDNKGLGFDPSYEEELTDKDAARRFTVVRDLYSEKYADRPADLVSCRHVLEHIEEPQGFMKAVRKTIGDRRDTAVYFEVPNVMFILGDMAVWDLIYEHVGYYSSHSLSYVFRQAGFDVQATYPEFNGQYLGIEALPASPGTIGAAFEADETPSSLAEHVAAFKASYAEKVGRWRDVVDDIRRTRKRAVIWGAGSKGVTILNILEATDVIKYAVDINPRKQGKHIAGTGQEIVPPERLLEYKPELVLLMNGIYEQEIRATIANMGLSAEFLVA